MTLLLVLVLAAFTVSCAPVAVRACDRKAGWPLAALLLIAAGLLCKELPTILDESPLIWTYTWIPDALGHGIDIQLALRADALSVFFALLALVIGSIVFIYSASYLPKKTGNTSFYTLMTAFMAAILMLVLADDVFTLFIAWELVSLASFMLIARSGGSGGELGSQRTLILTFIGGLTLLVSMAIAATQAGTTNIHEILASDFWSEKPVLTTVLGVLVAISAFTKSAQFPFHFWLPEAMAAATPVSAFLHAAAVVKAGIYVLMRFSAVFHNDHTWNLLLITVGMLTAVMAAFFAIQKTDLKKLTAYSTVSHLGWIVATIGVGTPFALAAALVHTLAHALFKSSLFMLIGVIDHQTGTRDASRLGSSWRQLPFTFGSVILAAASMAAVPPMLGFVSKEGLLAALSEAPLGKAGIVALLLTAGVGALFTFTYSVRIVADGFIDGDRDMTHVKEAPVSLWLPAALPGALSLPLAFALGYLDAPISEAVDVVAEDPHTHLALWHGLSVAFIISMVVFVLGIVGVIFRKQIWAALDSRPLFPASGNDVLRIMNEGSSRLGRSMGKMADSIAPTRHLAYMFLAIIIFGAFYVLPGLVSGGVDGIPVPARISTDRWYDAIPLVMVLLGVIALVCTKKRLSGVVLVGVVGAGVTLQVFMLGAPDVAMTQFMVEALTVVIMMMVVRQQPSHFHKPRKSQKALGIAMGTGVGLFAFLSVWVLLSRHERSELAMWYLNEAPKISGGDNVVNTILVEFRGFDTLGELSVLGMAAIVIAAVITSMPRYPFAKDTHPAPFDGANLNAIPLRVLLKALVPVLVVLSVMIFWRGHNAPGGGFIAALVASTAMMLSYLSFPRDKHIFPVRTPIYLTGIGILTAIFAGFLGLTHGSFLYAIHGHWAGQHWTTSMIFDVGVYLAVLGMVSMAINALGGYLRPGLDYENLNYNREDSPLTPLPKVGHLDDFGAEPHLPPSEPERARLAKKAELASKALREDNDRHLDAASFTAKEEK